MRHRAGAYVWSRLLPIRINTCFSCLQSAQTGLRRTVKYKNQALVADRHLVYDLRHISLPATFANDTAYWLCDGV